MTYKVGDHVVVTGLAIKGCRGRVTALLDGGALIRLTDLSAMDAEPKRQVSATEWLATTMACEEHGPQPLFALMNGTFRREDA